MAKNIWFDMDGTIADLYGVENWLDMLHDENPAPYAECAPLVNMEEFAEVCKALVIAGFTLGVISWSAMGGSAEYNRATRKAKREWCKEHCPQLLDNFHVVKYGTPKHHVGTGILVDDNAEVRAAWTGATIDPTQKNLVKALAALL